MAETRVGFSLENWQVLGDLLQTKHEQLTMVLAIPHLTAKERRLADRELAALVPVLDKVLAAEAEARAA